VDSEHVLDGGPLPLAVCDSSGIVQSTNLAWDSISAAKPTVWASLGLDEPDADDFANVLQRVTATKSAAWLDVDANVLAEKRWARCHIWPAPNQSGYAIAVVPLRESRGGLSRIDAEHVERILEHTADAITIVNEDMTFRFASGIATRWLGISGSDYEGQQMLAFAYPEDHHILIDAFVKCIENPRLSVKARFRALHDNGTLVWVEGIGTNMFDDPAIQGILVTLNDITELVETRAQAEANEAALDSEKHRYEALAQFTPTGVFELDPDNRLTFRNERFEQLLELPHENEFTWELFDERDRGELQAALTRTRDGSTTQSTVRLATDAAEDRWVTIRAVRQDTGRILATVEDATTQIIKQAELAHRADHDILTGLPNRENLLERLEGLTAAGEPIAVLFLDLDNFKDINDALGHQVGDQVLIEIADRIRSVVRPNDIVGRLHGDEFLVVCRDTSDLATAQEVASRVVASVDEPLKAAVQRLVVSGSVGIAMSSAEDSPRTPEDLLAAADVAMYEAKRRGGSRSIPYSAELGKRAADRIRLHGEVQRAGELDELVLHYQPIIELTSGSLVRTEALIRWHHPTQGFIMPERFIPDIEKSELIDRLGMWIVEQAISDLSATDRTPIPANVNVSPRQLVDSGFAAATLDLLDAHGVDGELITLEITELVAMDDFAPVEKQLELLRSKGVGIAIDDFGTGYSALGYLRRFPFDQVKIDGDFIAEIDTNENDQAIVGSMIDLIISLGATPIAEKVERSAQVDTLIALGCPLGQGFLLGKPAPLQPTH